MFSLPSATSERNSISLYKLLWTKRHGKNVRLLRASMFSFMLRKYKHDEANRMHLVREITRGKD